MYPAYAVIIASALCFLIGVTTGYFMWRAGAKIDADIKTMKDRIQK